MIKILITGASGMLGSTLFKYFSKKSVNYDCYGTVRSLDSISKLKNLNKQKIYQGISANELQLLDKIFQDIKPDIVVNCIGIIKQAGSINNELNCIKINSLFPHELAKVCRNHNARLIHFSTDCVFSGKKGSYDEKDQPDAQDIYGLTKRLGELKYSNTTTIRTSIIGHELNSKISLVDWFLSQTDEVYGYKNAIFSGMPTIEIARVIDRYIIPAQNINGLYQLSVDPIDKYRLLSIIKEVYGKDIRIKKNYDYIIDRSLDSSLFRAKTGFKPKSWDVLIKEMHEDSKN